MLNFRVFYPHHAPPLGSDIFDPATKRWNMAGKVERDAGIFRGFNFVHPYGWAATPELVRVGDYRPWDHVVSRKPPGPAENLSRRGTRSG